jgi:hypothetical protein
MLISRRLVARRPIAARLMVGIVLATVLVALVPARPAYADLYPCPTADDPYRMCVRDSTPGGGGGGGDGGGDRPDGCGEFPCTHPVYGTYIGNGCYVRPDNGNITAEPPEPGPGAWYWKTCLSPGQTYTYNLPVPVWLGAGEAPTVSPEDLARQAFAALSLSAPDIHIVPDPTGRGLVGLPVWMWTTFDWGPFESSATDGPLTVTISATVTSVVWDMGDGSPKITCDSGTPYDGSNRQSPDCGHVYTNPGDYTITASTVWVGTWSDSGVAGAPLQRPIQSQTTVHIGELQVVVEG